MKNVRSMGRVEVCALVVVTALSAALVRPEKREPILTSIAPTKPIVSPLPALKPPELSGRTLEAASIRFPKYLANYVYPDMPLSVEGVAVGEKFDAVVSRHPEAAIARDCIQHGCEAVGCRAHLVSGSLRVNSVDGQHVSFAVGSALEGPNGQVLHAGMDSNAAFSALGYPHGERQISFEQTEGFGQGRAWRYMFPGKLVWLVFREGRISTISLSQVNPEHRYFWGLLPAPRIASKV